MRSSKRRTHKEENFPLWPSQLFMHGQYRLKLWGQNHSESSAEGLGAGTVRGQEPGIKSCLFLMMFSSQHHGLLLGCHASDRWMSAWEELQCGCLGRAREPAPQWTGLSFWHFCFLPQCCYLPGTRLPGFSIQVADLATCLGSFLCGGIPYTKYTLLVYFYGREVEIEATDWWLSFCPHDHVSTTIRPGLFSLVWS